MNNPYTVTKTSEELLAMRVYGESRSRPLPEGQEPDLSDPDNPDCTAAIQAVTYGLKRTNSETGKIFTGLPLDAEILETFRSSGNGWQTRINEALREWLKTHKAI